MKKNYMFHKSKLGFTLIELVVVIAIVAILMSITIPVSMVYIKSAQKQGNTLECSTVADQVLTCLSKASNINEIKSLEEKDKEDRRVEQVREYLKKDTETYNKLNILVVSDSALKNKNKFLSSLPNDLKATASAWTDLINASGLQSKEREYFKNCCFVFLATKSGEYEVVKYHDGKMSSVQGEHTKRAHKYQK